MGFDYMGTQSVREQKSMCSGTSQESPIKLVNLKILLGLDMCQF